MHERLIFQRAGGKKARREKLFLAATIFRESRTRKSVRSPRNHLELKKQKKGNTYFTVRRVAWNRDMRILPGIREIGKMRPEFHGEKTMLNVIATTRRTEVARGWFDILANVFWLFAGPAPATGTDSISNR